MEVTMTDEEKRHLVLNLLEHYRHDDHKGLLGLLTDNCEFRIGAGHSQGVVPYHGRHVGHDQISGYLQKRRQHSTRNNNDCILRPPGKEAAPVGGTEHPQASRGGMDQFVVQGDTVVVLGHLTDKFADGNHMHKSDFALVFHIDEEQRKIRYFQYFFDTEAAAKAWRNRGP
jgi:ketosteroid isomerase-like protein